MTYHNRFSHFDRRTLTATRTLMRGWSTKDTAERWAACDGWLDEASRIYDVPRPNLRATGYRGTGCYLRMTQDIKMEYPSIMTLIHEFRHHLQCSLMQAPHPDPEDDARAWSHSLYRKVAPRTFDRLIASGAILSYE